MLIRQRRCHCLRRRPDTSSNGHALASRQSAVSRGNKKRTSVFRVRTTSPAVLLCGGSKPRKAKPETGRGSKTGREMWKEEGEDACEP